jgi:hypothetical protein
MNADSAFQIGAAHAVCQDYSRAGAVLPTALPQGVATPQPEGRPYVILSDGCSSSPDTDIGARLLVKAAEQTLLGRGSATTLEPAKIHREAARLALTWAKLLGLPPQAVDATLLSAHLVGEELVVGCSGDGVICLQTWAGAVEVYSISYASGYPLYPAYMHQPARLLALKDAGRSGKEVTRFRSASIEECLQPSGTSGGDSPTEVLTVSAANYKYVALFSDGIHSFFNAAPDGSSGGRGEAVPLDEPLRSLISFKSTRGAFVGRRLKRFLKDCRDRGWQHLDDLAFGALHLGG